jgi:hypothetical protein
MFRRAFLPFCAVLVSFGLIAGCLNLRAQQDDSHHGRKYKVPPQSCRIEVTVVRDYNGKPIADAHVIFHPIEGDKDKGALELKTNEDGKALIDVIPIGDTVTLQVIANGFQTYGQIYKIDKLSMSMEVRLSRPAQQYSVYKNPTPDAGAGNGSGSGTTPDRATILERASQAAHRQVPRPPIPAANRRGLPVMIRPARPIRRRVEANRRPHRSEPRPNSANTASPANPANPAASLN